MADESPILSTVYLDSIWLFSNLILKSCIAHFLSHKDVKMKNIQHEAAQNQKKTKDYFDFMSFEAIDTFSNMM